MGQWLKQNYKLLLIVLFLWLAAAFLYYNSTPDPLDCSRKVQELICSVNNIYDNKQSKREEDLTTLFLSEILRTDTKSSKQKFFLHTAIALFVAGILILAVEIHTRWLMRKEVAKERSAAAADVWKAVSGRLIPEEISIEIDSILKSDILRENAHYTITLGIPYGGLPKNHIVARFELNCIYKNLTGIKDYEYLVKNPAAETAGRQSQNSNSLICSRSFSLP